MPSDDLDEFLKRTGRTPFSEAEKQQPMPPILPQDPSNTVGPGILQGAFLGPAESVLRGGRALASARGNDPDVMTADSPLNRGISQLERHRKDVESTSGGLYGEIGGMMLPGLGQEAALARLLGRSTTLRSLAARGLAGAAGGAAVYPPESANQFITQAGVGGLGSLAKGGSKILAAKEAKALTNARSASVIASGMEGEAKAAMEAVKRKDPARAALAEDYYRSAERARIKRAAIPGNVPEGIWPFLHNLPHHFKLRLAQWLMSGVPPSTAAGGVGMVEKRLENPD